MDSIVIPNSGFITIGVPRSNAVFVITGIAHSGTTYMADCVRRVGVQLFYDHAPNLEDFHLAEPIFRNDVDQAKRILYDRPSHPGVWAFKRPFIFWHAATLREVFGSRLCWILIFRDPLVVANRWAINTGNDFSTALLAAAKDTAELLTFTASVTEPIALVSYEKFLRYEQFLLPQLKEWVASCASS